MDSYGCGDNAVIGAVTGQLRQHLIHENASQFRCQPHEIKLLVREGTLVAAGSAAPAEPGGRVPPGIPGKNTQAACARQQKYGTVRTQHIQRLSCAGCGNTRTPAARGAGEQHEKLFTAYRSQFSFTRLVCTWKHIDGSCTHKGTVFFQDTGKSRFTDGKGLFIRSNIQDPES